MMSQIYLMQTVAGGGGGQGRGWSGKGGCRICGKNLMKIRKTYDADDGHC